MRCGTKIDRIVACDSEWCWNGAHMAMIRIGKGIGRDAVRQYELHFTPTPRHRCSVRATETQRRQKNAGSSQK